MPTVSANRIFSFVRLRQDCRKRGERNICPSHVEVMTYFEPSEHVDAIFEPITIRLPKPRARCPWSGLTRSALNDLVLPNQANDFAPPVQSKVLKVKGASRGIRLIDFQSLKKFLLQGEEISISVEE